MNESEKLTHDIDTLQEAIRRDQAELSAGTLSKAEDRAIRADIARRETELAALLRRRDATNARN